MKTLLSWLTDPYVHLLLIGLILVRIAMGVGDDVDDTEKVADNGSCQLCGHVHASDPKLHPIVYRSSQP